MQEDKAFFHAKNILFGGGGLFLYRLFDLPTIAIVCRRHKKDRNYLYAVVLICQLWLLRIKGSQKHKVLYTWEFYSNVYKILCFYGLLIRNIQSCQINLNLNFKGPTFLFTLYSLQII